MRKPEVKTSGFFNETQFPKAKVHWYLYVELIPLEVQIYTAQIVLKAKANDGICQLPLSDICNQAFAHRSMTCGIDGLLEIDNF